MSTVKILAPQPFFLLSHLSQGVVVKEHYFFPVMAYYAEKGEMDGELHGNLHDCNTCIVQCQV